MPFVILIVLIVSAVAAPAVNASEGDRNRIRAMVVAEARDMRLAVSLALAVAQAESDFDPLSESHKGARGVMQIMPATAMGEYGIPPDMLWNPRLNIRLGLHFLKRLIIRYGGRISGTEQGSSASRLYNAADSHFGWSTEVSWSRHSER